ncbi:MAG TPA: bifunctional adenosylcobinamide kinase/adenosylcobinamide-phosphate guanylyltransferase [Candidatus Binataceae bacterium]|nr:bifunctional adenosylcobinamide kinase/adenosylcobinamide-phosphate guanylyltransferase [Candidatus Binataceae bacterium]
MLGGVRSGKSRLAERLAAQNGLAVTYVATATAGDAEMRERIEAHRARRPNEWKLVEEPLAVGKVLRAHALPGRVLIVDCLTLWLTNLLMDADPQTLVRERENLLTVLPTLAGEILLVSNETGLGIVPSGELARRFCDEAGMLHQALAACCDRVILTVAGLPYLLKGVSL